MQRLDQSSMLDMDAWQLPPYSDMLIPTDGSFDSGCASCLQVRALRSHTEALNLQFQGQSDTNNTALRGTRHFTHS